MDLIRTQCLEIVAENGKTVARLTARQLTGRPYLAMYDGEGRELLCIEVADTGLDDVAPNVRMTNSDGDMTLDLGVDNHAGAVGISKDSHVLAAIGGTIDGKSWARGLEAVGAAKKE